MSRHCAAGPPASSRRGTDRRRIVFADGRRVGALVDRNGLRPAAFAVTRDRLVAVASEAGAVPFAASETVRRGRLGPGELLLVEPGRRAILEDAEAKAWALRALPIHDASRPIHEDRADAVPVGPGVAPPAARDRSNLGPRPALPRGPGRRARPARHQDHGARGPRAAVEHGRRHADARSRPAWTARSRTTSARRSPRSRTRRSTRNASAWSWTSGSSSAGGRRCSAACRAGRGPSACNARSSSIWTASSTRSVRVGRPSWMLDTTWDPADGARGLEAALDRLAAEAVTAARRGTDLLVLTDAAWSVDRLPIPSILATGAVHTALTDAGLRGRTDIAVSAVDVLDVHAMAMVLAVGATAVHPRLAIELAAELAGTRGAETMTPTETVACAHHRLRGRPAQDARPDGDQRGRVVHRWGADRRRGPGRGRRGAMLPDRGGMAGQHDPRRPRRTGDPPARRGARHPGTGRRPRAAPARPRVCPLPRRRRGASLLAQDRRGDHPPRGRWTRRDRRLATSTSAWLAIERRSHRPAADRAVPRDELRIRRARTADAARRRSRTHGRSSGGSWSRR